MTKRLVGLVAVALVLAAILLSVLFRAADTEVRELDAAARRQAPGQFIQLTNGMVHYEIGGPVTGQPVVLVHGFSVPYYIWDTTFAALTGAGFRTVRYDIFGRGYSDRPDVDYNGALYERQATDLIGALHLRTPVDLIGLSAGGPIAMRVTANHPDLVSRVVLVDPLVESSPAPPYPKSIGFFWLAITVIPGMPEGQLTDFLHPENYPDWVDRYRVQMQYRGFRRAIISSFYEFFPENHLAYYKKVQEVGHPVKLIWGGQDQTLDIASAEVVKSVLDVDFMPVDQSGHLPHIEQAGTVNPAIVAFLLEDNQTGGDSPRPGRD